MTVSTTESQIDYTGNGATVFAIPFLFLANGDLVLTKMDANDAVTTLVLGSDYTLSGAKNPNGGTATLTAPLTTGNRLRIARVMTAVQETDLRNQGKFYQQTYEDALDYLTLLIQQYRTMIANAMQKSIGGLFWDALGLPIRNVGTPTKANDAATKQYVDSSSAGNNSYTDAKIAKTVRTPEDIGALPGAAARAGMLLGFDASGNPMPTVPAAGPVSDASQSLWARSTLLSAIANVHQGLDAQKLNLWEFAAAIMSKPTADPATWDWAPAFLAAAASATTTGWTIAVPPLPDGAPYIFGGSTTLVIDLARFGIEGLGDVMIDASTFTGTYVLQVTSSRGYPGSLAHNSINRVAHIGLFGNKTSGRHGVRVGDSGTNTYNGQISFWNCTVSGFDNNVRFDNNAWRIAFHNCAFFDALSRTIAAPSGLVNAGESIAFYHCMIADGTGDFEIACAGFAVSLHGCSVLNTKVILSGQGVRFDMFGGNMENPGATAWYRYIEITADTVHASMYGTTLVVNSAALQTDALFNIAANSVLDLHSVRIPDGAFQFETGAGTSSFAKGAGTLRGFGCFYPPVSGGADPNMGFPAQALANGDFETGNINGWTATSGGTAGSTATASSAAAKNGTYGARLDCVAGGTIEIRQTLPVRPGQMVMVGGWGRVNTAASSGNSATISLTFLDAAGNSLLSAGSNNNTVGSFVLMARSLTRLAPRGAVSVRFSAAAGTAANVDYDDLILNIL